MHREPPARTDAAALVQRLLDPACPPFALLHRRSPGRETADTVEVLIGEVDEVGRLADIPLGEGVPDAPVTDALALIPFRQIRERGFRAHDDGTPLAVLRPRESARAAPGRGAGGAARARRTGDGRGVRRGRRRLRRDRRAGGTGRDRHRRGRELRGPRTFEGTIADFSAADALALFRRLLSGERGAYWTYVVHRPGVRTLVGASPEVHVRMTGGTVVMNPISGTYRYPEGGPTPESLLAFLGDRKEVEELSMVVDEELKMMCTVGDKGGVVIGPRLKEMAHLAHTEYELRGRSTLDVREVLKETMFAATVTGSPVQNACRVIERYEPVGPDGRGRGYYAGALALIGRDAGGAQTLDSPILIRTADIAADGRLRVPVGATLVRALRPAQRGRRDARQGRGGAERAGRTAGAGPSGGRGPGAAAGRRPPGAGRAGCPPRRPGAVLAADADHRADRRAERACAGRRRRRTPSPRCWRICCAPRA